MNAGKVVFRILSLFLVFIFGFFSCIATIVGVGFYAYKNISYDKLAEWGLVPAGTQLVDPEADAPATSLTISSLIEELQYCQSLGSQLNLDFMLNRYGVILPEEVDTLLVEEIRALPLNDLMSEDGVNVLLENISVGTVLSFVPEGVVSEPAIESLKDKTLKQVVDGNYGELLYGVKLGYLLGVTYELDGAIYVPVFVDPENPTLLELLAPLDLGRMLTVFSEGGDMLEVIHEAIADVALLQLMDSLMSSDSEMLRELLDGKSVEEVIVYNEELGTYVFEFFALLDGMRVGDLLGLEPVYAKNDPTKLISWTDADGNQVVGYMRGIASFDLSGFDEENTLTDGDFLSHVYFGDLLAYVPTFDDDGELLSWATQADDEIDSAFKHLVMKPVNDLMDGNFTISMLMEGLYLGDILGYNAVTDEDGVIVWYNGTEQVKGMDEIIAKVDLEQLLDPNSGYSFMSAFEGKLLGDVLGYEQKEKDGELVWFEGDTEIKGIENIVSNLDLEALMNSEKEYSITDTFEGVVLGEVLGYEKVEDVWYDGDDEVNPIEAAVAEIDMGQLLAHNNDYSISSAFDDTFIGDLVGYERGECLSDDDTPITDRRYVWYDDLLDEDGNVTGKTAINGLANEFSNYNLYKVMEGEQEIAADSLTISEVLGMHPEVCTLYLDGEPVIVDGVALTTTLWYDNQRVRSNGIVHAIAEEDLGHLHEMVDHITIAQVVEYVEIEEGSGVWYKLGEATVEHGGDITVNRVDITPVSGVMCALADLKISDLSNDSVISERIQTVKVGDAMGWYCEDGVWYTDKEKSELASGTFAALADSTIGTLDQNVKQTKVGFLLGYTQVDDVWYSEYDAETETGTPVSGTLAAIVDFKVEELDSKINTLPVGKLLGWRYDEERDVWIRTVTVDGEDREEDVVGVMASIADFEVGNLSVEMDLLTYGEMFGWEKHGDVWYEVYDEEDPDACVPATGVMLYFADLTINEMTDNEKVNTAVKKMYVGDTLGWCYNSENGKWYENQTDTEPVTGIMQTVAGILVGNLDTEINKIKIGTILEWENHGGVWYSDYENGVKGSGILLGFADLSVEQMSDAAAVSNAVQGVKVGDAMGWYYNSADGKWYTDEDHSIPATGAMAKLADSPVKDIDSNIKDLTIADALGWRYDEATDTYYETVDGEEREVTGIMAILATTEITGVSDKLQDTKVGLLLDYKQGNAQEETAPYAPYVDESSDEPMSWYHLVTVDHEGVSSDEWEECSKVQRYVADTTLKDLDTALTELSIGDVVEVTEDEDAAFQEMFGADWKNLSIPSFFDKVKQILLYPQG